MYKNDNKKEKGNDLINEEEKEYIFLKILGIKMIMILIRILRKWIRKMIKRIKNNYLE